MVNQFKKLNASLAGGTYRLLVGSLIPLSAVVFLGFEVTQCSSGNVLSTSQAPSTPIPVSLSYKAPKSSTGLGLSGLNLVDTGTSLNVAVQGCGSGYNIPTSPGQSIASGVINLYRGDHGCKVELLNFTLGSQAYSSTGTGSVAFTSYLAGGYATFVGASATDLLNVFVNSQVTQSGVLLTDTVAYSFTDLAAGTTSTFSTANVSRAVPITVLGNAAPGFSVAKAYYIDTDATGHAVLNFDIACNNTLSGSGATASCDGNILVDLVDYILVRDNYSQGAITVAQATAAFVGGSPTAITAGKVIAAGGNDFQTPAFAVTLGGWATGNMTTSSQIDGSPAYLSWVLMARLKDTNGNTVSYIYWYVEIPALTQS